MMLTLKTRLKTYCMGALTEPVQYEVCAICETLVVHVKLRNPACVALLTVQFPL